MHARVSQLHFFAYESKLRYVRDSPEGAVKYSRQSPHRVAHPPQYCGKTPQPLLSPLHVRAVTIYHDVSTGIMRDVK